MHDSHGYERVKKAITEASASLHMLGEVDVDTWSHALDILSSRTGKIVLTGVGKSGYVAMKTAATLTSLGHPSVFVHPVEAAHGDAGTVSAGDVVIAFSFSGNTKELIFFLSHIRKSIDVSIVGITGGDTSSLAQLSDAIIPVSINEEGCPLNLAPMASTTTMLVIGDALSAGLTSPVHFTKQDFARFHPSGTLGLSLTKVKERALFNIDVVVALHTPLQDVLSKMGIIGKGVIAVVEDTGALIGSVTDGDVRRFFTENTTSTGYCARDLMSHNPKYLYQEQTLAEALTIMETHKITNVFVVDELEKPIGIIHIHDIVEI